jgi:hypothetical protein
MKLWNNQYTIIYSKDFESISGTQINQCTERLIVEGLGVSGGGGDVSVTSSLVGTSGFLERLGGSQVGAIRSCRMVRVLFKTGTIFQFQTTTTKPSIIVCTSSARRMTRLQTSSLQRGGVWSAAQ